MKSKAFKAQFEHVLTQIKSAWRYRRSSLLLLWAICLVGWAAVLAMPDRYTAFSRVQVDTTSTLEPVLGRQIVVADVDRQLEFVRRALLGTAQLEEVARETGLDSLVETEADKARLISELRSRISILTSNRAARRPEEQVYTIEYEDTDRERAIGVVSILLNAFIEDTLQSKRASDISAREFIDQQIQDRELRLREAEDRLAKFKKQHADRLPGSEGGYFVRLQEHLEELNDTERSLNIARSKRDRLIQQLSGENTVVASSDALLDEPVEGSVDARIREFEARLAELLLDYTERHPDVIAVRQTLDRLKAERSQDLALLGFSGTESELAALESNPVYQAIQISLNEAEVEIATLEAAISDQRQAVENLQALIDEVPETEAELARLNRDYEVIYGGYQELVASRETAELSSRAYDTDEVDFEVIDPPSASYWPDAPNRPQLLVLVTIFGAGLAGLMSFVRGQLNPVFFQPSALRQVAEIPVLGAVSKATSGPIGFFGREGIKAFVANIVVIGIILAAIIGIEIFTPGVRALAEQYI